jgi:hypothetical protein
MGNMRDDPQKLPAKFFRVVDFEKFQHYKDRCPPWIKLYRNLWSDPRFFGLTVGERYQLISLFIIASQNDNCIPVNQDWLKHQILSTEPLALDRLVEIGWIEYVVDTEFPARCKRDASTLLAERKQHARTETETETEAEAEAETEAEAEVETEAETNLVNNFPPIVSPATEKRAGQREDSAFEYFCVKHREATDTPYLPKKADFNQLALLRKASNTAPRACPTGWVEACINYFQSDLGCYSLADLVSRYAIFRNSPVDRFNRPKPPQGENRNGQREQQRETEAERRQRKTREAGETLLTLLDSQDSSGISGGPDNRDTGDVSGTIIDVRSDSD